MRRRVRSSEEKVLVMMKYERQKLTTVKFELLPTRVSSMFGFLPFTSSISKITKTIYKYSFPPLK